MLAALSQSMEIRTGANVELADAGGKAVQVHAGGESREVDWVLASLGRRPNLEGLGLEALGVATNERGIPDFDPRTLRLGDLPVYIAGDVNAAQPLMHEGADDPGCQAREGIKTDWPLAPPPW